MNRKVLSAIIFLFMFMFLVMFAVVGEQVGATSLAGGELKAEASIRLEGQRVLAEKNVSFSYQDLVFYGQSFSYDTSSEELRISDELRIESGDYLLSGELLEGDLNREVIEVFGGVVLEGPEVRATGNSIIFQGAEGQLTLREEVEFTYQDLVARATTLVYDFELQTVLLQEDVSGRHDGQQFSAAEAEINLQQGTIELQGEASIKFEGSEAD